MQQAEVIKDVLTFQDLAPEGILLAICFAMGYYIVKLRKDLIDKDKSIQSLNDARVADTKENTSQLLEVAEKVQTSLNQLHEVFRMKNDI